jgi:hypothetical protein
MAAAPRSRFRSPTETSARASFRLRKRVLYRRLHTSPAAGQDFPQSPRASRMFCTRVQTGRLITASEGDNGRAIFGTKPQSAPAPWPTVCPQGRPRVELDGRGSRAGRRKDGEAVCEPASALRYRAREHVRSLEHPLLTLGRMRGAYGRALKVAVADLQSPRR